MGITDDRITTKTGLLQAIARELGDLVNTTWVDEVVEWGDDVRLYREYERGDHRAKITAEMKKLLRIDDERTEHFNDNYCEVIIGKMTDRLTVSAIVGQNDKATQWADELLDMNRFDGLQIDVHEATVRDGDSFVMVSYDNDWQYSVLSHEEAWDGDIGVIPVYDRNFKYLVAAVKVWFEGKSRRVNIYYDSYVDKFEAGEAEIGDGELVLIERVPWTESVTNAGLGVPFVHFRNKAKSRRWRGRSELKNAVPLQDALNRTVVSMVMTAELTAFQIRLAFGFNPPDNLSPGMWVAIEPDGLTREDFVDARTMDQGEIVPFIDQANFIINQMANVTGTPLPQFMGGGANQSGEALKERQVDLTAKCKIFQTKVGNAWEDVMMLAAGIQHAFGRDNPPEARRWRCMWKSAEVRSDSEVIANANAVRDDISHAEYLRQIGRVYEYNDSDIQRILEERRAEQAEGLTVLAGSVPGFGNFGAVN